MGRIVNQTELAEIIGVSDVTIWQWQKDGMPVEARNLRGQSNEYDTAKVHAWVVDREVKKVRAESPRDALYREQTRLAQLQIAEKERALVPAIEVQEEYARMVSLARQRLLQIRPLLPVDEKTGALLEELIEGALKELARYDPSASADQEGSAPLGASDSTLGGIVGGGEAPAEREEQPVPRGVSPRPDAVPA